jgi:hypothetical protein
VNGRGQDEVAVSDRCYNFAINDVSVRIIIT